jgi:D-tyrosyl-tRNA(Tyr) deacylase
VIALLQRVTEANVRVSNKTVGSIDKGLLILLGIERNDSEKQADRLVERFMGYRIFSDADDKMNLSVMDISGGILLVPQFTLAADTQKGMRPGFSSAASPEESERLFDYVVAKTKTHCNNVRTGVFGADMKVSLVNDGPATFWLQV